MVSPSYQNRVYALLTLSPAAFFNGRPKRLFQYLSTFQIGFPDLQNS